MFGVTKVGDNTNTRLIREFIADSTADIDKLPHIHTPGTQGSSPENNCVHAGSTCFCIEDSSVWMLGNDDVWREL